MSNENVEKISLIANFPQLVAATDLSCKPWISVAHRRRFVTPLIAVNWERWSAWFVDSDLKEPGQSCAKSRESTRNTGRKRRLKEFGWRRPRDPTVGDASRGAETPPFYLPVTKVAGGWIPGFDWQGRQSTGLILFVWLSCHHSTIQNSAAKWLGCLRRFFSQVSIPWFTGWLTKTGICACRTLPRATKDRFWQNQDLSVGICTPL